MSDAKSPLIPLDLLAKILSDPLRWTILRELAKGEPLPVKELARRAGRSPNVLSKQMGVLRKSGVVTAGFGDLYQLAPAFRPAAGAAMLDLGHCQLKL